MNSDVKEGEKALLGVGLPVYNGEGYVAEAIESVLGQSLRDLRLVISDNASTDGTERICRSYAEDDGRVTYVRNPANIGIILNTAAAYRACPPVEYYAVLGHDDCWEPRFASRLVALLEEHPRASLAFAKARFVDRKGRTIREEESERMFRNFPDMSAQSRRERISFQPSALFTHGVVRASLYDPALYTERHGLYEDVYLLRALAAAGPFLLAPEVLFAKRQHGGNYSSSQEYKRDNRGLDVREASFSLRRRYGLSAAETAALWLNLGWYFKVRRPVVKNWHRLLKIPTVLRN